MTAEYSYFCAEGASLAAIDTIAEAKLEVEDMRWVLCQRYAASAVVGWLDNQTGRYTIHEFHFGIPSVAPEGWISTRPERQSEGAVERAMPVPGSADHFYITNFAGLIERAAGKQRLEHVLGSGEMAYRDMEARAKTSDRFVRYTILGGGEQPAGEVAQEDFRLFTVISGPWKSADPLAFQKIGDNFYIRVPNRHGSDIPQFSPPDAVRIPYDDMLKIDAAERLAGFNRTRAASFDPGI